MVGAFVKRNRKTPLTSSLFIGSVAAGGFSESRQLSRQSVGLRRSRQDLFTETGLFTVQ
jgi:hypothetical protein